MSRARDPKPRDPHIERPDTVLGRVRYCMDLMAAGRWVRGGTAVELAEDWGLPQTTCETYSAEASRHLTLLGDRDAVLTMVRLRCVQWAAEGDKDRVAAARLLVETVGGVTQKHEVKVSAAAVPDPEQVAAWLREHAPGVLLRAADELRGTRPADRIGATGMPSDCQALSLTSASAETEGTSE